jgi:hypothetical protein
MVPVTDEFYFEYRQRQSTYEAQYGFQSLDQVLARHRRRSDSHNNTASSL